ncbi:DotD/TraH family lipoprotein [Pseudoalteromonas nigrifaciens]|uniref:DotD/TraH family lipoprotein n=1 Tax=Pseudoalteromonas nigrifaciens TaxID=28109 RepID=UPI001787E11E|nr:DotD/TraH family lipoprotein [Pseudoalteromonas nigrifaciens]MBE0420504.1 DotD/TraH family lipoprotein [Pseudoalteromonas nigrifaciens]
MQIARKLITSILIAAFAGGCSSMGNRLVVQESDPAIQQLLEVAKDIAAHERQLYEIESARYIEVNANKLDSFNMHFLPAMEKYYSLGDQWVGPIEPLIEQVSELAGLNPPRYLNVRPSNGIIVYVDTKRRKLIEILADAGNQARQRAKVTLKMRERVIQVEYADE